VLIEIVNSTDKNAARRATHLPGFKTVPVPRFELASSRFAKRNFDSSRATLSFRRDEEDDPDPEIAIAVDRERNPLREQRASSVRDYPVSDSSPRGLGEGKDPRRNGRVT